MQLEHFKNKTYSHITSSYTYVNSKAYINVLCVNQLHTYVWKKFLFYLAVWNWCGFQAKFAFIHCPKPQILDFKEKCIIWKSSSQNIWESIVRKLSDKVCSDPLVLVKLEPQRSMTVFDKQSLMYNGLVFWYRTWGKCEKTFGCISWLLELNVGKELIKKFN